MREYNLVPLAIDQWRKFLYVFSPILWHWLWQKHGLEKHWKGTRKDIILYPSYQRCWRYDYSISTFPEERILKVSMNPLQTKNWLTWSFSNCMTLSLAGQNQFLISPFLRIREVQAIRKARFIGITVYPVGYLAQIAREVPNWTRTFLGHYTLLEDELNDEWYQLFKKEKGFGLMNAAPLCSGILSSGQHFQTGIRSTRMRSKQCRPIFIGFIAGNMA